MDIMTTLFDQDYITELYGEERENEGRIEGEKQGRIEGRDESKREIALSLIKLDVPDSIITQSTGLTQEQLDKLK